MKRLLSLPVVAVLLAACQPVYAPGQTVTLADGEICSVVGPEGTNTRLDCPRRGTILADIQTPNINEQLNPELGAGIRLSDIPGVPRVPHIPQSEAEAVCRAGQYAGNRVRGAAEGAVLTAVGLPGNLLGVWRRSQSIAHRINGSTPPGPGDPCAGL